MSDSFIEKTDRLLSEIDKELSNIYFSCTECSSPIELISYNEDKSTMEFKCLTEERHGKIKVGIKEYFEKIIKNKYQNEDELKLIVKFIILIIFHYFVLIEINIYVKFVWKGELILSIIRIK